jgi:para-aminobenzoate synthetase component I
MIWRELDWRSPYAAFAPLAGEPHAHLLHGGDRSVAAEWSIIVAFPTSVIAMDGVDAHAWLASVQKAVDDRALDGARFPGMAPFRSGLVGYVGYEAFAALEPSLDLPVSPHPLADAAFGVYDASAIFSRKEKTAYIVGRSDAACRQLERALGGDELAPVKAPDFSSVTSNFTRRDYMSAVSDVIERILNGDFYQANISQLFSAISVAPFSPFDLFRMIAGTSDAFFGALLQYPEGAVVSNSPERFFRLSVREDGFRRVTAEPVKGTRRRALNSKEDAQLAQALRNDPKDRAENIMIADLMRNDLSKICKDGTIQEEAICELLTLSHVHHLVSRIAGELCDGSAISDIFRALFPSGSITGAPKIEAMKAIAEIEGAGRGPYCGAIGYIDDTGAADFSVAIRTMMTDGDRQSLSIPVGGAVTLRSNPGEEYEETLVKAIGAAGAIVNSKIIKS